MLTTYEVRKRVEGSALACLGGCGMSNVGQVAGTDDSVT